MTSALIAILVWIAGASAGQTGVSSQAAWIGEWRAVVVAGDWRDTRGRPIDAFDNATRDVAAALRARGLEAVDTFSLRPDAPQPVAPIAAMQRAAAGLGGPQARGGCLFYLTSHGSTEGVVFGPGTFTPTEAAVLLRSACGARPTVVVVSACYSGVFLGALSGPNRMVMTAARPDRNSFGCGEDDVYPFFDACVIESLPVAADFIDLANRTRACVARREAEEGATPPSEPQIRIGRDMQLLLPLVRFRDGRGTPGS
ncbi:C13 family peptidase [Brevundimonas balnearis]|uniref:C13 family peptidase n=1 Tax=Brevundimonas balnearis TaxID=1572858 RepID=A0ABV6QZH2_9CAUL